MATAIIAQDDRAITVRLSRYRWNRIQKLEKAYSLARAIRRSMEQVETAPAMSAEETIKALRAL